MFVISGGLKQAGIYNDLPDLRMLDDGDVPHSVDFRSIYATVLARWMNTDAKQILGKDYEQLAFI